MLKTLKSGVAGFTAAVFSTQMALAGVCAEDAMLVFDGSGSMAERTYSWDGASRIHDAQMAVRQVMPEVTPYRDVGLLIYGPGGAGECAGINMAFGPLSDSAEAIIDEVDQVRPDGLTPLADSIIMAAEAMEYRTKPAIIVVVTDGFETCGGSPCRIAGELMAESAGLQIHVVGFNLPNESVGYNVRAMQRGARCLAETTGGYYVATETADELIAALNTTLGCMLVAGRERNLLHVPG